MSKTSIKNAHAQIVKYLMVEVNLKDDAGCMKQWKVVYIRASPVLFLFINFNLG